MCIVINGQSLNRCSAWHIAFDPEVGQTSFTMSHAADGYFLCDHCLNLLSIVCNFVRFWLLCPTFNAYSRVKNKYPIQQQLTDQALGTRSEIKCQSIWTETRIHKSVRTWHTVCASSGCFQATVKIKKHSNIPGSSITHIDCNYPSESDDCLSPFIVVPTSQSDQWSSQIKQNQWSLWQSRIFKMRSVVSDMTNG